MASHVHSGYFHDLLKEAKKRYEQKLDMLGPMANDPYTTVSGGSRDLWSTDTKLWPKVEYPDVYNYVINTHIGETGRTLKNHQSEHRTAVKKNDPKNGIAAHTWANQHRSTGKPLQSGKRKEAIGEAGSWRPYTSSNSIISQTWTVG